MQVCQDNIQRCCTMLCCSLTPLGGYCEGQDGQCFWPYTYNVWSMQPKAIGAASLLQQHVQQVCSCKAHVKRSLIAADLCFHTAQKRRGNRLVTCHRTCKASVRICMLCILRGEMPSKSTLLTAGCRIHQACSCEGAALRCPASPRTPTGPRSPFHGPVVKWPAG